MSLGSFGNKTFEVSQNKIYTFDGYTRDISLGVEDQDVDGDKPSTYIKGIDLEKISFDIKLNQSSNIDVEKEINEWKSICESGSPYMLFLGNNPVSSNKFLLTGISLSDNFYTSNGKQVKTTLKLTFKEYVRAGVKKEEGTSSKAKKTAKKKKGSSEPMSEEDSARVTALENSVFGDE
ncbi:phage tail protein [Clostridium saccharoperbutylacetonicum]